VQTERIRLYRYALSPFAAKVHCYLGFKGLAFETVYVHPLRARRELPVGHTIPVLEIDGEARNDSTPIGLWLEERFPERRPLLPRDPEASRRALGIDDWVTERLIPATFRLMIAPDAPLLTRLRGRRRGARVLHATVPGGIPLAMRVLYPVLVTRPAFIRRLLDATDPTRPTAAVVEDVLDDLEAHLASGPFLGGLAEPSLADLSAWAQLALPYLAGYDGAEAFLAHPALGSWFGRVGSTLKDAEPLLPGALAERPLPPAEAGAGQ